MKIGVIAVQGAVLEHIVILEKSMKKLGIKGKTIPVRKPVEIEEVEGLIIPGGETTTISKLLLKFNLFKIIQQKAKQNLPIMGTCAGCILLAKEEDKNFTKQAPLILQNRYKNENSLNSLFSENKQLKLMDMRVKRNAFGSQKESFESDIKINGFDSLYHAVFIRAPIITKVWGNCKVLAKVEEKIVFTKQENFLAIAFHPELTDDTRIHEMFLELI